MKKEFSAKMLWQLTRPHTLTASVIPVLIGTALALFYTNIHIGLFLAMLFACLWIQIATNLFNEYYDFKRGLDTADSVGKGGAMFEYGMNPKTVLRMAILCYIIALLLGVYICMSTSWWLAVIGAIGMTIGYLYTGGPYPIAYTPFGEFFAGLCMGSIFILIAFYIQVGSVNSFSILVSIPIAFLVGAINLANNIRDIEEDTVGGRKTLAILVGRKRAIDVLASMFIIAYIWIIALVIAGVASPWLLLVIISLPKPIQAIKSFRNGTGPSMITAMKSTAQTNTIFGVLLALGVTVSYFI